MHFGQFTGEGYNINKEKGERGKGYTGQDDKKPSKKE